MAIFTSKVERRATHNSLGVEISIALHKQLDNFQMTGNASKMKRRSIPYILSFNVGFTSK